MSDTSELEGRILSALDRTELALESMGPKAESEGRDGTVERLTADVTRLQDALRTRDALLQQMRAVNRNLRELNAALRAAYAQGPTQPDLLNFALEGELAGLRATREVEKAEIEEVLAVLEPVLKEAG
ncbi:MAG: hypothetical protein F4186_09825 [Boseongicola sp. SB0676_bin_33]|uniref:Uncharacterized protein n=1 Tax=Boseongicola sp. SB0664_bin_43 TaxID=2604844 RepID=A0A6B0Y2X0_9RHOB|nr:hypothetical protein [Boseongicola sp. SB0664_bin_43]MYF89604.1 hypothetical protein [Boseongicola sp. SB0676_bin_33]MYK30536.1 hypothetical protein [Boseongicola sp. SB0670_bin_30]